MKETTTQDITLGQLTIDYLTMVCPQIGAAIQMFRMLTYGWELPWVGDPHSPTSPYSTCGPFRIAPIPRQKTSNGRVINISGQAAHDYAGTLAELSPPGHISRIDLQVTLPLNEEIDMLGLYKILSTPEQFPWKQQGAAPYVQLIRNNEGGETIYIGKRTSDLMTRIYRKTVLGVECLRWEIELKGRLARGLTEQGGLTDPHVRATMARAVIAGYPDTAQLVLAGFDRCLDETDAEPRRYRSEATEDATLLWWSRTVIPALKKAMRGRYREEVLGLIRETGYELTNSQEYRRIKLMAARYSEEASGSRDN